MNVRVGDFWPAYVFVAVFCLAYSFALATTNDELKKARTCPISQWHVWRERYDSATQGDNFEARMPRSNFPPEDLISVPDHKSLSETCNADGSHSAGVSNGLGGTGSSQRHTEGISSEHQKLNNPHHIVIIGSGPTALGAARRLAELRDQFNTKVTILEEEAAPGGLACSERDDQGFLWDMGGHVVFSHYDYFDKTLDRAVPDWNQRVRAAFAFMMGSDDKRRFIPYPVQNHVEAMDKIDQRKSLDGLQEITRNPPEGKPRNFDQWLLRNFGVGLCEVFMRKYNKKVWTVETTEMNSVWVGERVAVPDVDKIQAKIKAFDQGNPVEDSGWGPNRYFRFPRFNGTGNIWTGVANLVPREWFQFQSKATTVNLDAKTVTVESGGNSRRVLTYDTLISTAPLDKFVSFLEGEDPSLAQMHRLTSQLIYSHTHVIGVGLSGQPPDFLSDKSWMYFPDSDSPFYRVTVFSAYSEDHVPKADTFWSLMCEVAEPENVSDPTYWTKAYIVEATIQALVTYGFISPDMVVSKYYRRLDHGYPVPSLAREEVLQVVQPWLEAKHIYSRGRFGGWRYEVANQDHSFMQGVEVVDRILQGVPEETYPNPNFVNSRKNTGRFLKPDPGNEFILLRD